MAASSKRTAGQIFWRFCFVAYCALMLWLLFGQRLGTEVYTQQLADSVNLKPFATIERYLHMLSNQHNQKLLRHAVINLAGNVVMFIPLGFFLPKIFPRLRGLFRTFFLAVLLICLVEAVQYVTALGTCDVDDLILNLVGVCLGYPLSKIKHN